MKKIISLLLCSLMLAGVMTGCGRNLTSADDRTVHIVATIFPVYDWVRQILGDEADSADVTLLLDSRVDLHSYQPTAEDMVKIANCDLFLYVGGESDDWVEDALREAGNDNVIAVNLLDALGNAAKMEEIVEGMEADEDAEDEAEYDEHIWLSLRNAARLCRIIAEKLGEIDAAGRDAYAANAEAYIQKLSDLDIEYQAAVNASPMKTVLFGDRFPFRYLMDDYGLSYFAAFSGCSAETEASFETVVFLAEKVDELGLSSVLALESGDRKIAWTIIDNTAAKNAQLLVMDSMQSTTSADAETGVTYLSLMERNLDVLKAALGVM